MLHLAQPTDDGWFDRIKDHLHTILLDHTHLEKRAGSTAMAMIFRYADKPVLAKHLSQVVQEEMEHFQRMIDVLEARQITYERMEPAPYAAHMVKQATKHEPLALLDKLLIASLIEARSCERFQILADRVDDPELADFYRELYIDEARHHTLYTTLARRFFDEALVKEKLDMWAQREVEALKASEGLPRLHSW